MDRREFVRLTGGAVVLGAGFASIRPTVAWAAQGATSLADLELPELSVGLTEDGFTVSPAEIPAGWTLVTFKNGMPADNYNTSDLMVIPAGETLESVIDVAVNSGNGPLPEWVFDVVSAGGPGAVGGATAQAVVMLTEGDWMVWSAGEGYAGAALTVTAGTDATPIAPALSADVEVGFQEYAFVGLDGIAAGPHVWKIENTGEQSHVMVLFEIPEGTTTDQLLGSFIGMMTGTPVPDGIGFDSIRQAGGCGDLSPGGTAWHMLDLTAGTYGAVCFVPDEETGAPHIMLGMGTVFTVA